METSTTSRGNYTADSYFALVEEGLLSPDENCELLDGIIVAMPPQEPLYASGRRRVDRALRAALGPDVVISPRLPLIVDSSSVPEPDIAILSGRLEDYETSHPTSALLVVEIADSALAQDRLTMSRIYARAGIPSFWIVNLRDRVVEWFVDPDTVACVYRFTGSAAGSTRVPLTSFPNVVVPACELLPLA